jgi:hypothetical protein
MDKSPSIQGMALKTRLITGMVVQIPIDAAHDKHKRSKRVRKGSSNLRRADWDPIGTIRHFGDHSCVRSIDSNWALIHRSSENDNP